MRSAGPAVPDVFHAPVGGAVQRCDPTGDTNEKFARQASQAIAVVSTAFAPGEPSGRTGEPKGSRKFHPEAGEIDQAIFAFASHIGAEVGRVEVFNAAGERLGITLCTSGKEHCVEGTDVMMALSDALAQAWSTGQFFDIKRVDVTHTHQSGEVIPGFFSSGDKEFFNDIKATLESLGLDNADLQGSALYSYTGSKTSKKTLLIPASASIKNGAYVSDNLSEIRGQRFRATVLLQIEDQAAKIRAKEIDMNSVRFHLPEEQRKYFFATYLGLPSAG